MKLADIVIGKSEAPKKKSKRQRQLEFNTYFLMRYVVFTVSLVTLQHLHKLQILVILFL